eukprot:TRINITY_DN3183_c0_g4_i1.p1 TRINITY_DN3183_c0_g4~~TRINITY_DN3183_c0_g4_i1.p1  ORF type:complete len:274 (+),score=107.39 TRINITY_DN3183_c0_g4_i1:56-877(+)
MAIVGNYELGVTLGCGGSSKVKAAVHSETGTHAAIKIQRKNADGTHEAQHELDVLAHIKTYAKDRSRIVDAFEVLESTRYMYIVLERVFGGDLFDTVVKKPLTEETARWVFSDVVSAMLELMKCGVAHRDVKPENILVDFTRKVAKLSDFGLSKVHPQWGDDVVCLSQARVGTEAYAAPEVLGGKRYNAYVSDCWSLGVTMFCAVTGRFPPKDGPDFAATTRTQLSPALADLILQLMQLEPEDRIPLKEILAHRWFEAEDGPSDEAASDSTSA